MADLLNGGAILLVAAVCMAAVLGGVGQLREGSHAPSLAGAADSAAERPPSEASDLPGLPLRKDPGDAPGDKPPGHEGRDRDDDLHHDDEDDEDDDREDDD